MHIIIQFSIYNFSIAKEDNIQKLFYNILEEVITSIFSILIMITLSNLIKQL